MHDQMNEAELLYVHGLEELFQGLTSWVGKTADVESATWVEEAIRTKKKLLGVLCFDTVGYTSNREHSQAIPTGIDPQIFQTQGVKDVAIGNFLAVIGDLKSGKLLQTFFEQSSLDSISLPSACLQIPFTYEQVGTKMRDLLRSDHAPFWQKGIPGLFLTDTADFRYPYYHTPADTIERLDFDFLTRICKATAATVIQTMAI
jgi:Zn-dependent M28 family amino/carboxypeptidase